MRSAAYGSSAAISRTALSRTAKKSTRSISSKPEYLPTNSMENALGLPCRVICGDESRSIQPSSCRLIPRSTCSRGSGRRNRSLPQRSAKSPDRRAWSGCVTSHHPVSVSSRSIVSSPLISIFAYILVPYLRIQSNVFGQQTDTLRGIEIDYLNAQRPKPIESALTISAFAHHHRAETELPHESAAVPTGRERGHHDQIPVTALS